ncbi:hypothetical protein GCM10008021_12700 [Deinococcus wulumuqiensis]|nr:hypothetical protein GCM10008021_12700 [Deinococcus wulumuqiensis]
MGVRVEHGEQGTAPDEKEGGGFPLPLSTWLLSWTPKWSQLIRTRKHMLPLPPGANEPTVPRTVPPE